VNTKNYSFLIYHAVHTKKKDYELVELRFKEIVQKDPKNYRSCYELATWAGQLALLYTYKKDGVTLYEPLGKKLLKKRWAIAKKDESASQA